MLDKLAFLRRVYERFNARDIDGVLACLHPDVQWANGQDGGYVRGHDGVRRYWTRQWTMKILAEKKVGHVFRIEDGLIRRFDIRTTLE